VFSGERAAEFQDQVGYCLRDRFELADALLGFEIDNRAYMQAADRCVRINPRRGFVAAYDVEKAGDEARRGLLLGMRISAEACGPSCGWQSDEQSAREPSNTLLALSFVLARHAEAHWRAAHDAHAASNRAGQLRAYGNAIVPQVAAEFVSAVMETLK